MVYSVFSYLYKKFSGIISFPAVSLAVLFVLIFSTVVQTDNATPDQQLLYQQLFSGPFIITPPEGEYNAKMIKKWEKRYKGEDIEWETKYRKLANKRRQKYRSLQRRLIEGWQRLTNDTSHTAPKTHLQMVYEQTQKHGVPFEIVFVALNESHWTSNVRSTRRAKGYWQFITSTAKIYGLKVGRHRDERTDPVKSTDAAIKFLKDLYQKTYEWEGKTVPGNLQYTDGKRWLWAFWSYNRGPGKVKMYYKKFKGNPDPYAYHISRINSENSNFVSRMFGIRQALKSQVYDEYKLFAQNEQITVTDEKYEKYLKEKDTADIEERVSNLVNLKESYLMDEKDKTHSSTYVEKTITGIDEELQILTTAREEEKKLTKADLGYEDYLKERENLSPEEMLQNLETLRNMYLEDGKYNRHTDSYVQASLDAIDNEMNQVKLGHPDIFSKKKTYEVQNQKLKIEVSISDEGESETTVQYNGVIIEADIVSYKIQHGDKINDIARRLSGDVNKVHIVKETIINLNPEIKNINRIYVGQEIKVPGRYIEVGRVKLSSILKEYYPRVPARDAEYYLKYLNGITPGKQYIRPHDVILVPAIL